MSRFSKLPKLAGLCVGLLVLVAGTQARAQTPPSVAQVPANAPPAVPAGMKVTCTPGPGTGAAAANCPVVKWGGYTYWAFSYVDNRVSMGIVAYDSAGKVVKQWEKAGARYVYAISVDATGRNVTFAGQADQKITMTWGELMPLANGSRVALQADTGNWLGRCNGCQKTTNNSVPDTAASHVKAVSASTPYAIFEVMSLAGGKIALKADTGKLLARCNGCIVGGQPDALTVHATDSNAAYAQFTPVLLPNGKYALKADTGKYVARCYDCSPGATVLDTATIHVADPNAGAYAQWSIVPFP